MNNIVDLTRAYLQIRNKEIVTIDYNTSSLDVKIDYERITVEN